MLILNRTVSRGYIELLIQRASGRIDRFVFANIYTDAGLSLLSALEAGEAATPVSHMGLGIGTTAPEGEDETLESEIAGARVPVTKSGTGSSRIYSAVFGDGVGNGAVTEAALFNAASGGTMSNRTVFGVKTKQDGEVFTFNWTLSHQRA
ncbi:hypothetical protein RE432_14825 [Pusillimonas sp. SM2304]|uniref:hypothetical protein n=1 Tax=Pusillimonas sp. SM2304 TaxID=3073241 RepID=UPI0028756539|nr:hypothetical protein [Pusillimonas sp. SM2304]MDS1141713.1 hypothetical protein [Pusillimonas sp. SM2304]